MTEVAGDFNQQALEAIELAVINGAEFGSLRAQSGDVFAGAIAAGLENDAARQVAVAVHTDPSLLAEVDRSGGLLVGARYALEERSRNG